MAAANLNPPVLQHQRWQLVHLGQLLEGGLIGRQVCLGSTSASSCTCTTPHMQSCTAQRHIFFIGT
jgi:hypothetical protein